MKNTTYTANTYLINNIRYCTLFLTFFSSITTQWHTWHVLLNFTVQRSPTACIWSYLGMIQILAHYKPHWLRNTFTKIILSDATMVTRWELAVFVLYTHIWILLFYLIVIRLSCPQINAVYFMDPQNGGNLRNTVYFFSRFNFRCVRDLP